jgi:hypothetical protein
MSYPGGKGGAGVYQTIINQQPPHDCYIEPFLGGGSVMLHKRPASSNLGIDRDAGSIARFRGAADWVPSIVVLKSGDGISYLEKWRGSSDTLIYCDPPYLLNTRSSQRPLYRYKLSEDDHVRLLHVLRSLPCMVQVSGYYSRLYADMLKGWRMIRYTSMTRGGPRRECLWMNYAAPTCLHDYRYLGEDYRERERIGRRVRRWRDRLVDLHPLERQAILSRMTEQ